MTATNQTSRCPNCGGIATFDIARGLLVCGQCGSTFALPAPAPEDPAAAPPPPSSADTPLALVGLAEAPPTGDAPAVATYRCESCGADIVAESRTGITVRCHYCHNPVVLMPAISGEYAPDAIVPFTITREAAVESFRKYTSRHRFTRRAFFDEANIEKLTGVYLPYFAVDAYLEGEFTAEAERRHSFSQGNATITDHQVFALYRRTRFFIDDYAIEALTQALSAKIVNCVQPFDLTKLAPFDYRYLVGFQAERRDLGAEELEGRMQADFASITTRIVTADFRSLGYDSMPRPSTRSLTVTSSERKYCLLPVWLFTYLDRAKGKTYYYAVNGQSGEASGILPVSGVKVAATAVGIMLAGWVGILGTLWAVG
jgi:ribosomal protein L37AE/L43A